MLRLTDKDYDEILEYARDEMKPQGDQAREKLVKALLEHEKTKNNVELIESAKKGDFGDFTSPHVAPKITLYSKLIAIGARDLAIRVTDGDFDG